MNMYVQVYKVFLQEPLTYALNCVKCYMVKVCAHVHQIIIMKDALTGITCFILKVCAHLHCVSL